jgi:hypothetical protein
MLKELDIMRRLHSDFMQVSLWSMFGKMADTERSLCSLVNKDRDCSLNFAIS